MSKEPLLAPEAGYETEGGFRNDVIFPGGMVLEENGEVKIYYGAANTVDAWQPPMLTICFALFERKIKT